RVRVRAADPGANADPRAPQRHFANRTARTAGALHPKLGQGVQGHGHVARAGAKPPRRLPGSYDHQAVRSIRGESGSLVGGSAASCDDVDLAVAYGRVNVPNATAKLWDASPRQ